MRYIRLQLEEQVVLTARYQWEYGAEARFEGESFVLTLIKGF